MYKYVSKTGSNIKYNVTLLVYIDCDNGSSQAITQDEKGSVNIFSYNPTNASYSNYSSAALLGTRTGPVIISDLNYKFATMTNEEAEQKRLALAQQQAEKQAAKLAALNKLEDK